MRIQTPINLLRGRKNCGLSKCAAYLLLATIFSTQTGCHVVGIPSYRFDQPQQSSRQISDPTAGPATYDPTQFDPVQCDADCPPGILPPLPGWLAKWCHKEEELPEPSPYPRFHPLPTRPMFAPRQSETMPISNFPGLGVPEVSVPMENINPAN